jgi:hypothetical protein
MTSILNDIIARLSSGNLTQEERDILVAQLGGGKVRSFSAGPKVPTEGLKIACQKFPVTYMDKDAEGEPMEVEIPGAYREVWYITSPVEMTGGTKHYVSTRRSTPSATNKTPWPPQFVQLTTFIGTKNLADGSKVFMYGYDQLKSDGTKRVR